MKGIMKGAVITLLLVPGTGSIAGDEEASVKQCQALKDRIERYTALRRKGGSARRMEGWRDQLRNAETKFRERDCRAYRRELK